MLLRAGRETSVAAAGSCEEAAPNHPFHRIAARLRFGMNVKGRV